MADVDVSRIRQLDSMNDAIDTNRRLIKELSERHAEGQAEIMTALKAQNTILLGNGMPEHGLSFRMAWIERAIKGLLIGVALLAVVVIILVLAVVVFHL